MFSRAARTVLTVGNGGGSGTFSGTLQNTSGTVALVKTGAGTQLLSGTNTYSGGTTLSSGALSFTANAIPVAPNSIGFVGGGLQWASGNTQDVSAAFRLDTQRHHGLASTPTEIT